MLMRKCCRIAKLTALVVVIVLASSYEPALALIVNFESVPTLSTGPSLFSQAGAAQTVNVNGAVTFSGGVVVGFPTNFPASPFSTPPNVYGTGSPITGADRSLSSSINMSIDPSFGAKTIQGLLFNGWNLPVSYTVSAFSGTTLVDSMSLPNLPSNLSSGFSVFRLNSSGPAVTSVRFNPDLSGFALGQWDYVIDTIAINEPIENVAPVPVPAAIWLFGSGMIGILAIARRQA
jgi:hypothetical protein